MLANLPPSDPQGQRLCEIFSYRWLAIAAENSLTTSPNWQTIGTSPDGAAKYPMKDRTFWQLWSDINRILGTRFGNFTSYGLLDIDRGSKFLTAEGIEAIKEALETIGLVRFVVVRSSRSGGIHIYFPLPYEVPTFDLACAIKYALEAQEIYLEPGQVEAFPNVKSYGRPWLREFTQYNAHRLPLQPGAGSMLLDHNLQPDGGTLEKFFALWDYAAKLQDDELLDEALKHGRDQQRKRRKLSNHPVEQWRRDLELTLSEGWTGRGQTNHLLKEIACYGRVFQKLEGYELAAFIERVAKSSPGYLEHCDHQSQIERKAQAWARSAEKYYYPIGSEPKRREPIVDWNAQKAKEAAEKISKAVMELAITGQLPSGVRERARKLARFARSSIATLYKNLELWHPDQWCVTAGAASDTANCDPSNAPPPNQAKRPSNGLLHTPLELMKCDALENLPEKNLYPDSRGKRGVLGERWGFPQAEGGA